MVSVTPWYINEEGKKRPLKGYRYDSRSHEWHDDLTLPDGADYWGIVPADLGCVVVDIDEGDPTALMEALGYPPATRSVSGKTHAWVRYDGREFSKVSFKAHGCSGELLHAGSGSVEPDWPAPVGFAERAPLVRADLIERLTIDAPDGAGRNQKLHKDLIAAEPDSDDWFAAIEEAQKSGLGAREIAQTTKSVEKYREKNPWEAPKPAQYDFMAGDYGHTAKAFAEWLRMHEHDVLFECGNKWYTRRGDCWLTDHKQMARAGAVVDDWIVELVQQGLLPATATLDTKDPRKWISSEATKRAILRSLSVRADFERQPEDLNLPPAVGLPDGSIVDGGVDSIVTRSLPANPAGECPQFLQMLERVIDDEESLTWFRGWLRVALAGLSEAQSIVLYGPGGTGKSYLVERVAKVFGTYAKALQSQTLFVKTPVPHEAWKTAFFETRLVYDSDVRDAYWGSTDWLKLTAGDKLSAAYKGGQPFEFKPTAGLLVASNHPPTLMGDAEQRRVVPISCGTRMVADDGSVDRYRLATLNTELDAELPGAVKWLLDLSLRDAMAITSKVPDRIVALKAELIDQGDPLGAYLRELATGNPVDMLSLKDLLDRMQLEGVVDYTMNSRMLAPALRQRGWKVEQKSGKMQVLGMALPTGEKSTAGMSI